MSETSGRPLYVPKRNRKRQRPERLHGAFTGGYSAGHFNSVGSKDGWKSSNFDDDNDDEYESVNDGVEGLGSVRFGMVPSSTAISFTKRNKKRTQKVEDYMDEEDANEWGGPTKVKDSFHNNENKNENEKHNEESTRLDHAISDSQSLRRLLLHQKKENNRIQQDSIGKQLLKVLGWREKRVTSDNGQCHTMCYAYIPVDDTDNDDAPKKSKGDSLLSTKRLKRIEMQLALQQTCKIPMPKIDTYGMGFEPYKNAPEFKAHRERRRKRAEEHARAATSTKGVSRMNVYSMSAFDENDDDDDIVSKIGGDKSKLNEGNDVLAYETVDDFVGNTTVAGFALHDDDDQVYDKSIGHSASLFNKGERGKVDLDEYHNEVYEGSDSEVEDGTPLLNESDLTTKRKNKPVVNKSKSISSTIQSFAGALDSWVSNGVNKRQTSEKAVTSDGALPLEGFELGGSDGNTTKRYRGPDVPADYQVKPHQFLHEDAIETLKESSKIRQKSKFQQQQRQRDMQPIAGKTFSSLSTALKDRFTSSSKSNTSSSVLNPKKIDPRHINIIRTTISWQPSHLLLKRFNVSASHVHMKPSIQRVDRKVEMERQQTREEAFFQNDVLSQLGTAGISTNADGKSLSKNYDLSGELEIVERPPLKLMKSIFEVVSSDEEDKKETQKQSSAHLFSSDEDEEDKKETQKQASVHLFSSDEEEENKKETQKQSNLYPSTNMSSTKVKEAEVGENQEYGERRGSNMPKQKGDDLVSDVLEDNNSLSSDSSSFQRKKRRKKYRSKSRNKNSKSRKHKSKSRKK